VNYIKYLNDFNKWLEEDSPTDKAVILYYAMLNMFNRRGWPRWAGVDTQRLMSMARTTSNKTAYRARDALVSAGFLEYKSGKKGSATEYSLVKYRGKNDTGNDIENDTEIKYWGQNDTESDTESDTVSDTENDTPNKTKTKTKTKINNKSSSSSSVPARDEALGRVMSSYMDKIDPTPSSTSLEELKGYVEKLGGEVCMRAIDCAIDAGADKRNWLYIRGILRAKQSQGVRSLADWDRLEEKRGKGGKAGGKPGEQPVDPLNPPRDDSERLRKMLGMNKKEAEPHK